MANNFEVGQDYAFADENDVQDYNPELTDAFGEDDDAMLPDGYSDGDDFFDPDSWSGSASSTDEPKGTTDTDDGTDADDDGDEDGPTSADNPETDISPDNAPENTPTTEPSAAQSQKLRFTSRIDHKDVEVELDPADLPTVHQKASIVDRVQARLNEAKPTLTKIEQLAKAAGHDSVQDFLNYLETGYVETEIAKLTSEGVHEVVAKDLVERKLRNVIGEATIAETVDEVAAEEVESPSVPQVQSPNAIPERDFRTEVRDVMNAGLIKPGDKIPDEVAKDSILNNKPLIQAFTEYNERKSKTEAEQLRKENTILKQNAASAARAPVRGVSGGAPVTYAEDDDFIRGFDSDEW